jgi:hypothetical protein
MQMYYEWMAKAGNNGSQDAAGLVQPSVPCIPELSSQQVLQLQQQKQPHDQPQPLQHEQQHQQQTQQQIQQQNDVEEVEQLPAVHTRLQPLIQQAQLPKQQQEQNHHHQQQQQQQQLDEQQLDQQDQQQQQQPCKPAGDRALLSRLLGPAGTAALAAGSRLGHKQHQQQQQQLVNPEQPVQPSRGQGLLLSPTAPAQTKQADGQRQQQQQQLLHQQQGRKRRHDPHQLQQQLLQQQEQQQQPWQQQQLHGQSLLDAQSQAPAGNLLLFQHPAAAAGNADMAAAGNSAGEGSGGQANPAAGADLALAGNSSRHTTWLPPAPAGQQLFSPRTATHAPRFCEASCPAGDSWQQQQWKSQQQQQQHWELQQHWGSQQQWQQQHGDSPRQQQQHEGEEVDVVQPTPTQLPKDAAVAEAAAVAAVVVQERQAHATLLPAAAPLHCSPQQQQQQHVEDPSAAVSEQAEVVAATPLIDSKSTGCLHAATPRSQVQLGSVIAESPAVPDSACADDPAQQKQQQQMQLQHVSKQLFAGDICDRSPRAVAAAANRLRQQQQTGSSALLNSSSSSSKAVWLSRNGQQQRVRSLHVGQPIVSMSSCQGQCIVAMQNTSKSSSSSSYELLQLRVEHQAADGALQQQQQQACGSGNAEVCVSLMGMAALIAPGPAAAAAAPNLAAALKVLPRCNPWATPHTAAIQQPGELEQQLLQQQQQGILLAVALPLELQDISSSSSSSSSSGRLTPAPPGTSADRARSASPAAAAGASTTPGLPISAGWESTSGAAGAVGGRTLRSLSHSVSTGKKKGLTAAAAAAAGGTAAAAAAGGTAAANATAGEAGVKHGVSIYRLLPAAAAAAAAADPSKSSIHKAGLQHHSSSDPQQQQQQQQQQAGPLLVQSLTTSHAVSCLAVSEEAYCLAAAGAAGFACVWPLLNQQQHLQQQQHVLGPSGQPKAARVPVPPQQQQRQVVDADGVIVLPSASYRSFLFPSINQLCFVLQPGKMTNGAVAGFVSAVWWHW